MIKRVLLLGVVLAACGPFGPLPGGELDGELASTWPPDWSFTDDHWQVQLEVRPEDPYSVNLWCAATNGRLYVGSGSEESSVWGAALLEDGRARIRVGVLLYNVVARRVTDPPEIEAFIGALSRKYDDERADATLADFQPSGEQPPEAMLFRLEAPPA